MITRYELEVERDEDDEGNVSHIVVPYVSSQHGEWCEASDVDGLEADMGDLEDEIESLEGEIDSLNDERETVLNENEALQGEILELEAEIEQLRLELVRSRATWRSGTANEFLEVNDGCS